MEQQEITQGWDARQEFVRELVIRGHLVGQSDTKDPNNWLETVTDYYDWACVYFDKNSMKQFEKDLAEIDTLLYTKIINGKYLTNAEISQRKTLAYQKLRDVFRKMHREAYLSGAYMPIKKPKDPKRAIANYND